MALDSQTVFDLAVIGAGPAGSAAAITAARDGVRVLQLEAGIFPRHKVCGEFISAEAIELLTSLFAASHAWALDATVRISEVCLHAAGKTARMPLRRPAISLSRAQLDVLLWKSASQHGVVCKEKCRVRAVANHGGEFRLATDEGEFPARAVVNCSGRWSELSVQSHRKADQSQKWIGLKGHFHEADSTFTCDLYFFPSGYCGVLPLGNGADRMVNAAAMVRADRARNFEELFSLQPQLRQRARSWHPVFSPISTSPLLFRPPLTSHDGILLAGDAAGFIDPFTGDGISLAIHSGIQAASAMSAYIKNQVTLPQAVECYDRWYRLNLLPAFSNATRLRRLQGLPRFVQRLSLSLLNIPLIGSTAIELTRVRGTSGMKFARI